MNEPPQQAATPDPAQLFCPQCGKAMLVDARHIQSEVACPHCAQRLEPWRLGAARTAQPAPSAPPIQRRQILEGFSWRNRWVAGALGILLGTFGVHRFYLGYTKLGLLQLILTVGSVFVLYPVVAIWTFIEAILCFVGAMRDADGLPLRG